MSNTAKVILAIIIILIVLGIGVFISKHTEKGPNMAPVSMNTMEENEPAGPTEPQDSDEALERDMAAISTEVDAASRDSDKVNQSFNDEPISQ